MEDETNTESTSVLSEMDFERIRCNKCNRYLNHPPIVAFLEKDHEYLECGRCFKKEIAEAEGLHPVRNHTLELLASLTPFPCKNHKDGCAERRKWPQIEVHEQDCIHRTFICPLADLNSCEYQGTMQKLIEHFNEKHSKLLITNGLLKETFNKNFENCYLIHQDNNIFAVYVKCDINIKKIWFISYLLEEKDPLECNLEFKSEESAQASFVVKHTASYKPETTLDPNKALEVDLDAVKLLLKEKENISCKIYSVPKFPIIDRKELLKEIQCPACWEFMNKKIFICKNGHNICSKCKEFVTCCPSCRDDILEVRNLSMETIVKCALFPCKNHTEGCTYIGTIEELLYHLKYCPL